MLTPNLQLGGRTDQCGINVTKLCGVRDHGIWWVTFVLEHIISRKALPKSKQAPY